jgi:hypothetical protein
MSELNLAKIKLTKIQSVILQAVRSRPNDWLNVHGDYAGEALSLQCLGVLTSRLDGHQLQVKAVANA